MEGRTQLRINEFIHEHVARIMHRLLEIEPGHMVTVTRVETAPDLSQAYVYVTVFPENVRGTVLKQIRRQASEIREELDNVMRRKQTPKLLFRIDEGSEHVPRMQKLFEQLDEERDESTND